MPQWSRKKPINGKYLIKKFKSYGGVFIKNFKSYSLKQDEYYQKKIFGEHLSIQFFVLNKKIEVLTVCNQYFQEDTYKPFLIKSIITKKINCSLFDKLSKICQQVTEIYNLNGINNLDLILELETEKIYIAELNGRPGLSTNLIYKIHRNIYKDVNFRYKENTIKTFFGTQIIYSKKKILINGKKFDFIKSLKNSRSFSDLPLENTKINKNEPIFLIHLESNDTEKLKKKFKKLSYIILNNLD